MSAFCRRKRSIWTQGSELSNKLRRVWVLKRIVPGKEKKKGSKFDWAKANEERQRRERIIWLFLCVCKTHHFVSPTFWDRFQCHKLWHHQFHNEHRYVHWTVRTILDVLHASYQLVQSQRPLPAELFRNQTLLDVSPLDFAVTQKNKENQRERRKNKKTEKKNEKSVRKRKNLELVKERRKKKQMEILFRFQAFADKTNANSKQEKEKQEENKNKITPIQRKRANCETLGCRVGCVCVCIVHNTIQTEQRRGKELPIKKPSKAKTTGRRAHLGGRQK